MAHTIKDVEYDHGHGIYMDDPDTYHVDRILKCRTRRNKVQYLVKWTGYSNNENSWVAADDITPDLKKSFKEQQKTTNRTTPTKRKRAPLKKRSKKARQHLTSNLGSFKTSSMEDSVLSERRSSEEWSLRYDTSADSDKSKRSELQRSKELFNES